MGRLDKKVALVTGGGSGIGRAAALAFAHTLELKAAYAQYPMRTTAKEAMAGLTRPTTKP